jgi:hypothetical protein
MGLYSTPFYGRNVRIISFGPRLFSGKIKKISRTKFSI